MNAAERAQVAAWAGLKECRTDLLAARVWALEAQIRLTVAGHTAAASVSDLSEKLADALEHCEAATLRLGGEA